MDIVESPYAGVPGPSSHPSFTAHARRNTASFSEQTPTILKLSSFFVSTCGCLLVVALCLFQLTVSALMICLGIFVRTSDFTDYIETDKKEKAFREAVKGILAPPGTNLTLDDSVTGDYSPLFEEYSRTLLTFGSIGVLWAIVGCGCAMRPIRGLSLVYITMSLIIVVGEVSWRSVILTHQHVGKDDLKMSLQSFSGANSDDRRSLAWNAMMYHYECCGVTNHKDFYGLKHWPPKTLGGSEVDMMTPLACCKASGLKRDSLGCALVKSANLNNNNLNKGCYNIFFDKVFTPACNIFILLLVGFQVCTVIVVAVILFLKWRGE